MGPARAEDPPSHRAIVLSTEGTIYLGAIQRRGALADYYGLTGGPPEPRIRRSDLAPGAAPAPPRRSLLSFIHLTDMHVVDVQSPGRYEFMERFEDAPEAMKVVLPAQRPQETLQLQACAAMIQTINTIHRTPVAGSSVDLLLSTGDAIDNAQSNELAWFLRLMTGGTLDPTSGGTPYEGVQSATWGDEAYWLPHSISDEFKRDRAFPTVSGLLDDALRPFGTDGLQLPWLTCYGNHDALILGAAVPNDSFAAILAGREKSRFAPAGFQPEQLSGFIAHPERYLTPPVHPVSPDVGRGICNRAVYGKALESAGGTPFGHGFAGGGFHSVYDGVPGVRLITLDTTNPAGGFQGSLPAGQARWLERRLAEVHSRYFDREGVEVRTGNDNRLVIVGAHNPLDTLTNARGARDAEPRLLHAEVESLLHRFPNVALWVAGHTHQHRIVARADPLGRTSGFWEITTASLIDWPIQARLVELVENEGGSISIHCTTIDHDAPLHAQSASGVERLASLHRELAANDPHAGFQRNLQGSPADRTVELVLDAPFEPLS